MIIRVWGGREEGGGRGEGGGEEGGGGGGGGGVVLDPFPTFNKYSSQLCVIDTYVQVFEFSFQICTYN